MKYLLSSLLAALALSACDTEDPTTVVIDNDYPSLLVYKAWWVASYLPDTVAPGKEGASQRTVPNDDFAYVVLADADPPTKLYALKSLVPFKTPRGEILHIHVSDATFGGNCTTDHPLSQADADFVTQRIFPGEFADGTYDAATCTFTPTPAKDAGTD